jgi:hypothetical protein
MTTLLSDAATLTLQIAAFLQSEAVASRSAARWTFIPSPRPWPGGEGFTFADAVEYLNSLEKPVVIGALNHPGTIAVWKPSALEAAERQYVEQLIRNQVAGVSEVLPHVIEGTSEIVLFEGWGARTLVAVPVMGRWLAEYGLTWGWRLGKPTDSTHCARLLVWHTGSRWSPGEALVAR